MLRLLILLLCFPLYCFGEKLVVATEEWEAYTSEEGGALYEDMLQQIFGQQYSLEFIYTTYPRSKALVKSGRADFWLGAYKDEESYIITPDEAMDMDFVYAIYIADPQQPDTSPAFFKASAVWMQDYFYDIYFPEYELNGYEVTDIETAFRLLKSGKADLILGDEFELRAQMEEAGIEDDGYNWIKFGDLPLYPAFRLDDKTHVLVEHWNTKIAEMKRNGQLKALFDKHHLSEEYPFF